MSGKRRDEEDKQGANKASTEANIDIVQEIWGDFGRWENKTIRVKYVYLTYITVIEFIDILWWLPW